jgi:hypothetical protein
MREEILCRVGEGSHAHSSGLIERADYESDAASNTCMGGRRQIYLSIYLSIPGSGTHQPVAFMHAMPSRGKAFISSWLRLVPS